MHNQQIRTGNNYAFNCSRDSVKSKICSIIICDVVSVERRWYVQQTGNGRFVEEILVGRDGRDHRENKQQVL